MPVSPRYEPGELIEEFFREHHAKVQAICRSLLSDSGEAEDASQQVFLAAFRALAGGTVPRRPEAWLAAIARNECRARAQSRPPVAATNEELESPGADPSALMVRRAEVTAVWEAVKDLPPTQREAFLLREVRGLSYKELADDLHLTHPSIRSLLARARQAIRARIGGGAAAIGSASWLESLARLLTGGPGLTPAAIATKTVAAGLGAAAITGGAIVAPELRPHPRAHREAVMAPRRHAGVTQVRRKPAYGVDPVARVENAPSAPSRPVFAREPVVAKSLVHHGRHETEPSVSRIEQQTLSNEDAHPLAAATAFVSDHQGEQAVARRPASPPTPGPSPAVAGTEGDGESGHDSGSTGQLGDAEAASGQTVATPTGVTGQAMRQSRPSDGEGERSSRESRSSSRSDPAVQPTTSVSDGSRESSDRSPQLASDGTRQDGSDGSGGD
jgi:RNA polymerase sigma-70 factor (ECF subfamily)